MTKNLAIFRTHLNLAIIQAIKAIYSKSMHGCKTETFTFPIYDYPYEMKTDLLFYKYKTDVENFAKIWF